MPWIFLCLMMANAVYFGLKFVESGQNVSRPLLVNEVQLGKPIVLLSEQPKNVVIKEEEPAPAETTKSEEPRTPLARQCYSVGPFANDGSLERWAEQMRAKRFVVTTEKRRVETKDYWVFVPPFTNREKAEERLRELKARGVDGFIVNQGMFVNAISLNRFSKPELAQSFLKKMQEQGLTVEYRENNQTSNESWVNLAPGASNSDLRASVDDFLAKNKQLRRENVACSE